MDDCIFCKIARGEIPSSKVYENDQVFAFRDIHPQAPVHVLVIPKKHAANILEGVAKGMTADLMEAVAQVAKLEGVEESGFRVITNCGRDGAQSVQHLHFHVLGGRQLPEQMG